MIHVMEQALTTEVSCEVARMLGEDTEALLWIEVRHVPGHMDDLFGYLQLWDRNLPLAARLRIHLAGDIYRIVSYKGQILLLLRAIDHHRLVRVPDRHPFWMTARTAASELKAEMRRSRWPVLDRPN